MSTILIVDDDAALRDGLAETLTDLGHDALTAMSGREAIGMLSPAIDAILLDLRMPGIDGIETLRRIRADGDAPPVIVLTAYASPENTIEAMRLGAFDHLVKPIGRDALRELIERLPPRPRRQQDKESVDDGGLIGTSEAMRRVQKMIGLAADADATIMIRGETGTGKELVARALHVHSRRSSSPFIAVNCAAIPQDLLESELFGHVKGSFTGASSDRSGAFRDAGSGTLFLDEIGDMPQPMQAKILRALQERIITPVGGKPVKVAARVVAATHRDLAGLVASGTFREDLYYRLNVIPIELPPLRERVEDILPLANHFLALATNGRARPHLSKAAGAKLAHAPWPGNVRELRNVIERACVLTRGALVDADDIDIPEAPGDEETEPSTDLPAAVARLEERLIRRALAACGGNRTEAARQLNINRQLLYTKMQRYGLGEEASGNLTGAVGKDDA
ncbi:sigma-54-dependent Fis family transcriptional regulator [Bradyrhizobium sp. 83012]|uniref:Sigma-54-dependent Fis family transcriptional regulator n=1 Tax=Bradyrhizobium aeschynomenes TaxID=2734909 RepID=A0ABX2C8W4_9BRAD|nr:sigma-54 dependent transcriptional regulator [Bradyrhizobium aeschynomenes]NPU13028.1 sigma-54-dependent Fis family transcriptional regulator [Bradyrhizobium aeschynomenes]NPU63747.1 sigma-54-dependent Fis family transcriptional regulator [Bradyrhizobium aeschynomenes]NPV23352.1 sigma-54-dependent Fis family transcriptional regulator [Bradyrhizobium aeschynomenes]